MTNFEKIKSMDKDELVHFISGLVDLCTYSWERGFCAHCDTPYCYKTWLTQWLESEVEA